jgi:hypothetical protein
MSEIPSGRFRKVPHVGAAFSQHGWWMQATNVLGLPDPGISERADLPRLIIRHQDLRFDRVQVNPARWVKSRVLPPG